MIYRPDTQFGALGVDPERDRAITAQQAAYVRRSEQLTNRLFAVVLGILGAALAWHWFTPCEAATLCSTLPLVPRRRSSRPSVLPLQLAGPGPAAANDAANEGAAAARHATACNDSDHGPCVRAGYRAGMRQGQLVGLVWGLFLGAVITGGATWLGVLSVRGGL